MTRPAAAAVDPLHAATLRAMTHYQLHAGLNCFARNGATDLGNAGVLSLSACTEKCTTTPGCSGFVREAVNVTWATHAATNCYADHGATDLPDMSGSATDCQAMTAPECLNQCYLTPGCTGAVTGEEDDGATICCLRKDINLAQCDRGGTWTTHALASATPAPPATNCYLRGNVTVAECDATSETFNMHVANELPLEPWWLTTHFAERTFMPRHFSCSGDGLVGSNSSTHEDDASKTCTLVDLKAMLPAVAAQGYNVVNIDWPVESGPDALYEGFGAKNFTNVDPLLGTVAEWDAFASAARGLGMKLVADFNPSYMWTGSPSFRAALADVKANGPNTLPADSPARWFRWKAASDAACGATKQMQPADSAAADGFVDGWVRTHEATGGSHCYWSIWGNGQPCADLASMAWRTELKKILAYWVTARGLDGILLDAPPDYLASAQGTHDGQHHAITAQMLREAIVEPAHALGAAVFGEMYNFQFPTVAKMLDGGRNTNVYDGTPGFPGLLHDMVAAEDASGLETLLVRTRYFVPLTYLRTSLLTYSTYLLCLLT